MATGIGSDSETAAGDLLAAALDYAAAGLPVLPLDGKVPRNRGGLTNASHDVAVVADWWQRWPDANIGIRTGADSGLFVLDVDTPKGGARTLAELERQHGKLPRPHVLTGGGGYHYLFAHPGREVRNSAGALGHALDTRGDGGYIVAPPSVHVSGRPYKLLRPFDELEPVPAWLLEDAKARRNGSAPPVGDEIPEGARDSTLASLAGSMRRRGMGKGEILAALNATNCERCRPPLAEGDVERIAASVARYEPEKVPSDEQLEPFELAVVTARALCDEPDPDTSDELLGPLLVERYRTLVGGHTGEGKTTLGLAMVRAVVAAGELLGFRGRGDVRALVLDAEQGTKSLKRRLREAGLDEREDVDVVRVPDGLSLDADRRHVAEVDRVLRAGDYRVVLADPFYKLHAGDSNAEREAVDLMRRFDAWRDELGFALILPLHCRKPLPGTKFSIHDVFGSSAYVRGAEVVLGLQRLRDGYSRLHFLKDRDGDLPIGAAWGLLFDRESGYRRDPEDGKHVPTTAELIHELLEATPEMTKDALIEATGKKLRTVEAALREIGAVAKRRGGAGGRGENVYSLTDEEDADSQPTPIRLALDDESPR